MKLIERLRCYGGTTPKYQKQAAEQLESAEAVIAAARKVIRTHPMSQSRDEQIRKLLEVIVAYDKGDELQATTQCSAEAVIEAARAWCQETVAAGWSDGSIVRADFAPRELALFDAIIAYYQEQDDG